MLLDIMSHVFPEVEQLHSAFALLSRMKEQTHTHTLLAFVVSTFLMVDAFKRMPVVRFWVAKNRLNKGSAWTQQP